MTVTNPHTHEVAVDTRIAEAYNAAWLTSNKLDMAADSMHYAAGDKREKLARNRPAMWHMTIAECLPVVEAKAAERKTYSASAGADYAGREYTDHNATHAQHVLASYHEAFEANATAWEAYNEAEKEYTGWSRFFWCTASGGHIHSTMRCSTCNKGVSATSFRWHPELSGLSMAEAVGELGPRLCTVCYPEAPVEWTNGDVPGAAPKCPGSGMRGEATRAPRYSACPECGKVQAKTPSGLVRAHTPEKQEA